MLISSLLFYDRIVADNLDFSLSARIQTSRLRNQSIHWTHHLAIRDRVVATDPTPCLRGGWTAARKASWFKIHLHSVELNCRRVRISDIRVMDAISQVSANAELFKSNSRIYLYCCDFCYTFSFTVPSLPFLEINGIFAHFSFLDSPSERRMCILPLSRELLAKLDGHKSPVVADVQSSVVFEVCFVYVAFI